MDIDWGKWNAYHESEIGYLGQRLVDDKLERHRGKEQGEGEL